MDIVKIVEQKMGQNSYLIIKDEDAILIDAGVVVSQVEENLKVFSPKPKLRAVLLTHCHFDHIRELDNLIKKYECPAYIFKSGKPMLYNENHNLSCLEAPFKIKAKKDIKTFKDSEELVFGNIQVLCYNTPGHSVDSSVFVIGDNMFTGDTVFKIEVGRTDLYSGQEDVQLISLKRIRDDLSRDIKHFYPGHGPNFNKEDMKYNIDRILGENEWI
ncbi:MAG: MBL fold metallo-hydrolase [Clostridia bacterium]|nr:MBL fold metallo-hydrolase [Clostridia bacterium]